MTVIRYSAGKLLGVGALTGAFAGFWLWVLLTPKTFMNVHGRYGFLLRLIAENSWLTGALFMACFGATALLLSVMLGDRLALAIGPDGVDVRTLLGRHRAGWDQVAGVAIEKAGPMGKGGETLTVRLRRDLGEKVVRLSTGLLEQSRWEINRQLEAIDRPGVRGGNAVAAAADADMTAPTMDYDAAIARHLAAREAQQAAAPVAPRGFERPAGQPLAARGGFGRKGL